MKRMKKCKKKNKKKIITKKKSNAKHFYIKAMAYEEFFKLAPLHEKVGCSVEHKYTTYQS